MKRPFYTLFILMLALPFYIYAQEQENKIRDSLRLEKITLSLERLINRDSVYNNEVDLSVGKISLQELLRNIAKVNGVNISIKDTKDITVSCNFNRVKINELLYFLCKEYELDLDVVGNIVSLSNIPKVVKKPEPEPQYARMSGNYPSNELHIDSLGRITAFINNGNIQDIITDICNKMGFNYHFITPLRQMAAIYLSNAEPETIFNTLLTGTSYTYYIQEGIYFFGEQLPDKSLTAVSIVPLKYRAVDKVTEAIPLKLKEGVQVQVFADLNSIILSGNKKEVARIEEFLRSIDRTVPLITMDIMIVEANKNRVDEAGISMGVGEKPVSSSGQFSPGLDVTLGANTVNRLINSFNGFGSVKLGSVSPNFYMSLKFLESNGNIVVESTPKLSTLNGQEALLTSGETQYYKEVHNTYMGTQNPVQSTSYDWKSVEANLTIKITPYMSSDSLITLNIDISQSEFTPRIEKDAPPGIANRSFKSIIRVANGEVVLLGGIERNTRDKSSRGLPWISRVPVLKWIFGSTTDNKSENKLNVFIRPTIIN